MHVCSSHGWKKNVLGESIRTLDCGKKGIHKSINALRSGHGARAATRCLLGAFVRREVETDVDRSCETSVSVFSDAVYVCVVNGR